MTSNPPGKSNPVLCGALISLGVLCLLGTIWAAFVLKDGIIRQVGKPPRVDAISDGFKIQSINREIEWTERDIELQKKALPDDPEAERRKLEEQLKRANIKFDANKTLPFSENKAEKLKELEEKKRRLIAERDEFTGKSQAKKMKPRTWEEFFEHYRLDLLLPVVLPLGLFVLFLARLVFGRRLPARNPLSLTDFERRSVLFLPFAIVSSAFGFCLFVWILAVFY